MTPIVYTLEVCPNCVKLKYELKRLGVEFKEQDMQSAESITEMRVNGCFAMEAPVLQVGEEFYEHGDIFKQDGEVNSENIKRVLNLL